MPKTATPRKPETVSRKLAETRNTSKNRSLSSLLGIGDNEKRLATDLGSGLNDVIGRGTIAGLLGLPGDLGGAAENGLRSLLGLPQVVPYGGSEHIGQKMEQAGLVSDVRRPKTELLASLISPAQAATAGYKAPQMARAGVQMMDNLASAPTMARMGQRGAVETNLGKMVAPQDEALRVAQANALPDTDAGYAPIGSWVRDPFTVEGKTPIRQVREIPLDRLVLPELDTAEKILPHKAAYVERYAEAMRNGDVFPNLRGSELESGMIKIQDGHRRALAAKLAGKDSVLVNVDAIDDYWIPAK